MPRIQPDRLDIFEDIYRARMRASLYELEHIMSGVESFVPSNAPVERLMQASLRQMVGDALTDCEQRVAALRARYAALPELPAKQEEVI